jgi:pyruvate/2-oxoglutarate dehydrogenase complex dihydrolipoamide acyltransferase (E2) component
MFCAMGKKSRRRTIDKNGDMKSHKSIQLKFVLDERICDGFYYASSMRILNKILNDPSVLLLPPVEVKIDEGVGKKRIDV